MANVDLQQIRTVRPAVLPLDTKQTLFELQQENLLPGEKSTVATLEEIQSSPATFAVVDHATHTTGLETEIHVTAATCAITADAATWPIGATKKIWKLSAYDGNPVTITPPSGTTIEGRSEYRLYEQYASVTIERVSETEFVFVGERPWQKMYDGGANTSLSIDIDWAKEIKLSTFNINTIIATTEERLKLGGPSIVYVLASAYFISGDYLFAGGGTIGYTDDGVITQTNLVTHQTWDPVHTIFKVYVR